MNNIKLSENAVDNVLAEGALINREKHRTIQKMDRRQLERYLANVYKSGFVDGLDAVQEKLQEETEAENDIEEVKVGWDDVLQLIGEIKGIGPTRIKAIDQKLKEMYE